MKLSKPMQKDTPKKKREFGVILESIESTVQQILEGTEANTRQLEELGPLQANVATMGADVAAMKTTLEQVNLVDLKQEVADLQKRMAALESKTA